jgi:hypothetical protein
VEAFPAPESVFPRIAPGSTAQSDRRDDFPGLLHHANRRAVNEDLAGGYVHALRVHRSPQEYARDSQRYDHDGCKEGFHGVSLPGHFPF